jgi:hypothetical protein
MTNIWLACGEPLGPTGREDGLAMVESLKGVDIFALVLAGSTFEEEPENYFYYSLIVRQLEGDSSSMQRLGFLNFGKEFLGDCSQLHHIEGQPIVTLV